MERLSCSVFHHKHYWWTTLQYYFLRPCIRKIKLQSQILISMTTKDASSEFWWYNFAVHAETYIFRHCIFLAITTAKASRQAIKAKASKQAIKVLLFMCYTISIIKHKTDKFNTISWNTEYHLDNMCPVMSTGNVPAYRESRPDVLISLILHWWENESFACHCNAGYSPSLV